MKLAVALRDIAEERSRSEIEQALDLCTGFADRVSREPADSAEQSDVFDLLTAVKSSLLSN